MKRLLLVVGVFFVLAVTVANRAMAADAIPYGAWINGLPTAWVEGPECDPFVDYACPMTKTKLKAALKAMHARGECDPYLDYKCLDTYLGQDPLTRFFRYYQLEWGKAVAPADPNAPVSQRPDSSPYSLGAANLPYPTPPMPFVAWPYGGTQNIGATIPNAVDSPFMTAIANTAVGQWLNAAHVQIYGWVDPAGNLSSNHVKPAGNLPVSYDYTPNIVQLDQAVLYIERVPDEVQNDHFDWGFRVSGIYGVDDPMMYLDLYWPVLNGLNVRIGRYISIPDIEAQLAPNNYTYVHSLTYTWDNYTNGGIEATLAMTKNWILQTGVTIGTEAAFWHWGEHIPNQYVIDNMTSAGFGPGVDPLFPGKTMLKDPGAIPSLTLGVKWTSDDGNDDLNMVMDAWNTGTWGYNNLQWLGFTYYHKFNDYWHIAFETWNIHETRVPNLNNASVQALLNGGGITPLGWGTPFSTGYMPFAPVNAAFCKQSTSLAAGGSAGAPDTTALTCNTDEQTFLLYVNYSPNKLNNFSLRTEYFNDPEGQRTGVATAYADIALGWQHWLSPQIELRPEIGYYRSLDQPAFNGNAAVGIAPDRNWALIAASDLIVHF